MAAKFSLLFCAIVYLVQNTAAQCIGNRFFEEEIPSAYSGLGYGVAPCGVAQGFVAPSSGGGFAITSTSPIAPNGISVISENAIEGPLTITGELPFLGAVTLEGALESLGAGGINYGCGNGAVGIVSEGLPAYAPAPAGVAPGRFGPAPALGYGYNGIPTGCGYGPLY